MAATMRSRVDVDHVTRHISGKSVSHVALPDDGRLAIHFTDGSLLLVKRLRRGLAVTLASGDPPGEGLTGRDQPTRRQREYLEFITRYIVRFGVSPAESDIQRHFLVSAPAAHQGWLRATLPVMERDVDALAERMRRALAGVAGIRLAYLFGSRVTGRARADSDLDLAVKYDLSLDPAQRLQVALDVVAALTDELGPLGERADVVDLDRASSAVGFRAIRDGRRVIERDPAERVRLETRIARTYDDDAPRREVIRRAAARVARRLGAKVTGRS